ncbi:TonB-dependent receptor [Sulfidibacter corallicola]|uniref:TonB-dependent receptor n=1 Tax=Sulfidibacter corallicola TaxID=2818388 RepID=A0A8A4TSQ7_SULCO|nr:TonB-dependent receptor [Sulfidibacter corallicola]QTD52194.1 TonB-dependent receptor [Sulfidibacter corallicola]
MKRLLSALACLVCFHAPILAQPSSSAPPVPPKKSELSLEALLNLKVSIASRMEQDVSEAPSIVSVITAQEIENMGARTLEDVLRTVPGFDTFIDPSISSVTIAVRGVVAAEARNNNIKFLLNGHAHNWMTGGPHHYLIDHFPVDTIDRLEIIRGPGSALYGTSAFVGVVNIITKQTLDTTTVSLKGGSFSSVRGSVNHNARKGDLIFDLKATYYDTDGAEELVDSDSAVVNFGEPFSAAPNDTTREAESFVLQTTLEYQNWQFDFFHTNLERNFAIGLAGASTDENTLEMKAYSAQLSYKRSFADERGEIKARVYYDFFEFFQALELFPEETAGLFSLLYPDSPYPEGESILGQPGVDFAHFGPEIDITYETESGITYHSGLLYKHAELMDPIHYANNNVTGVPLDVNGTTFFPFQYFGSLVNLTDVPAGNWILEEDRSIVAAYVQGVFNFVDLFQVPAESFALTLGVRHDDYDDFGTSTNPRGGVVWSPNEHIFLKLLYGTAFRAPDFNELYQINNPVIRGNPNLDPEELKTAEFQIGFKISQDALITASYFKTDIDNAIQDVTFVEDGVVLERFDNIGSLESEGGELDVKYVHDRGYIYFNFTLQEVTNTTRATLTGTDADGNEVRFQQPVFDVGYIPETIFNLGSYFEVTETIGWNLSLNHTGERDRTEEVGLVDGVPTAMDPREPTPERTLVNSAVSLRMGNWRAKLAGFNLLDEDHRDPDASASIANDLPREGTTFQITLSYDF